MTDEQSAADRAHAFVKERILTGIFAGGTLITEGEVSDALNMSRTPTREAFLRLQAEGLLRLYPKRGALVVPVSVSEIHDVLDARLLIERHAAETVIHAGHHQAVAAAMRAILDRQREVTDPPGTHRFSELDRLFHSTLVNASGNQLLAGFYAALRDRQLRMSTNALLRDPNRFGTILTEHAYLCDLLEAGDAAVFATALTDHLVATRIAVTTS
ncbi:MAG TPA: GntR family transcriptional regulator [Pseudonocardiaceae bacterium]|jgi:DNA-binding GntR family transcriptional regulator|nr:GntR family transcriptional regulator [Pseudonocardiaceae bacterium]